MSEALRAIDLNADLGEGFPNDDVLLGLVTSASIACGGHAGDSATMLRTLWRARELGVRPGAHPGFDDRESFGRRERSVTATDVEHLIRSQVELLRSQAHELGMDLDFVKPHGALYNQAQRDPDVAQGVIRAMIGLKLILLGQPGSVLEGLSEKAGVRYITEGFPDRRYRPDGRLVPRTEPNAIMTDPGEMASHIESLVNQGLQTLCIHGDDPHAVRNAQAVRTALERRGVLIRSFA
jgi:UPF0271 protein